MSNIKPLSHRDERGAVIPLVALALVALIIMTAIAVDGGNARQNRRYAQAAADAGALAGAKALDSGVTVPANCLSTDVRCVAAYYTFQSAGVRVGGTMPTAASCNTAPGANQTCSHYELGSGTSKKTVEVTSPYSFGGATCTGVDPDPCKQYVHVVTTWSSPNAFGKVANITLFGISGKATAQNTGLGTGGDSGNTPPQADCSGEDNFAKADGTPDLIQSSNPVKFGTNIGAHFHGDDSVLDGNSITMNLTWTDQNGSHNTVIGPGDSHTGYKINHNPPYPANVDINYVIPNTLTKLDSSGNRIVYTISLHAADVDQNPGPDCGNASFTFTWDGKGLTGSCGENSFLNGGTYPNNTTPVTPSDLSATPPKISSAGAHYSDESEIQSNVSPYLDSSGTDVGLYFAISGPGFTDPSTGDPYQIPKASHPGTLHPTPNDGFTITNDPTGHDKFNRLINWDLPDKSAALPHGNWVNGATYTMTLKAYDTDNNKPGNDCGQGSWTFTINGATGRISLIE